MRRVQIPDLDDTQALIWYYDDFGDRADLLGHDGDDPGTSALMFFDPETGDGALLVANGIWVQAEANALLGALVAEAASYRGSGRRAMRTKARVYSTPDARLRRHPKAIITSPTTRPGGQRPAAPAKSGR